MKSIVKLQSFVVLIFSVAIVHAATAALAGSSAIQQVWLDDRVAVSVPVATNRVTTISFPSPIDAIDGAGITVDGKTPGLFQLAHVKGSAFLSVRALESKASANVNIRWNDHTYVFELIESNAPVLALNMAALPTPEEAGAGRAPEVSPLKLLSLLDKARAFPLLKAQQPESVADVGFTTYDGKPLVSDFNDYQIQIEASFRFNAEDTLVFRVAVTNETDTPLIYQPDSFSLRTGNRLYPQSISDAGGIVPPKGRSIVYFAVTGTPDGGRNDLSLKNNFTVLFNRLSPPFCLLSLSRTLQSFIPFVHPKASHETPRILEPLQNQDRQDHCVRCNLRRRVGRFQCSPQTSHTRRGRCFGCPSWH